MALSRRDVLIASCVGFVAWGLLVKWLPLLRFLGYAFVAGVLSTIITILLITLLNARPQQEIQVQHGPLRPIPALLSPSKWANDTASFTVTRMYKSKQLYPDSFVISQALDHLISLALRDFVLSWYLSITKSPTFVNEIDKNIRLALENLRDRIFREDLVTVSVQRIVPILTAHLHDFDQAERIVRGRTLNRNITESEELDLAIAAKYREGKLHPAASLKFSDAKIARQEHLRKLLVRILPELLPENVMSSRAVSVLIKEIVACGVLFPLLQVLGDPDTWNQIVESYGRMTLQDRKTVRKMRAALDEHTSLPKSKTVPEFPRLAPYDSERAFERFVRAIRRTNNLSDARRFRSQVTSQLKRESLVEGQDPTYIRRLETGKRVLDQKVAKLSNANPNTRSPILSSEQRNGAASRSRELSLVQIMHTASGLSYFMEYMDRQNVMSLVQFWIVVDGFRNPLEDDFGDDQHSAAVSWTDSERMDIAQISETYMSKSELKVPEESKAAIKAFLAAGRKATPAQYRAARTAILAAQSAVLEEMESKHLPSFRKSDLYYKFLATDEASGNGVAVPPVVEAIYSTSPVETKTPFSGPGTISRKDSQPAVKSKDLRRAAMSSSDIRSLSSAGLLDDDDSVRRSFDTDTSAPLFDDGYDTDPLAHSTASIGQEPLNGEGFNQRQVIESMQAAMNDIMTETPVEENLEYEADVLFGSPVSSHRSLRATESPRNSLDAPRTEPATTERSKPNLATLGLVNTASRIGVFADNDLFPDEEKFIEDEYADESQPTPKDEPDEEIHEAAPGDLGLAEAITALTNDIERLVSQESVVETLTRKAELTNNLAELRILGKSKDSLQREIRRKELQRQQYIVQESDNSLYGRSSIRITSVMVGKEDDGREFALYVIEVQRQAGDQMPAATWAIARRYSEFHDLHQRLRRRYPSTRGLEFPRRRVVMKLQKQFLHNRRVALERYLQQLLNMPDVCRSRELRSFLSQQAILPQNEANAASNAQDIVTRIYNSVTDGMDEFLGNISVLDQLSTAGQNLISAATSQLGSGSSEIVNTNIEPGSIAEAEAELRAFEDRELEPFVKPICDIFLETFELNRGNNWLRGRAVVVVLHQLLGGTVERKVRDLVRQFTTEDAIMRHLDWARDTFWPGGQLRETPKPRTTAEKVQSKKEAGIMLATLIPDLAASVVGRTNAQAAARRILATMNNERLNTHLAFTILDEIVAVLFSATGTGVAGATGIGRLG